MKDIYFMTDYMLSTWSGIVVVVALIALVIGIIGTVVLLRILERRKRLEVKFAGRIEERQCQPREHWRMTAEEYVVREFDRTRGALHVRTRELSEERQRTKDIQKYLRDPYAEGKELMRIADSLKSQIPEEDYKRMICVGANLLHVTAVLYPQETQR